MRKLAERSKKRNNLKMAECFKKRAEEAEGHADRLRGILKKAAPEEVAS